MRAAFASLVDYAGLFPPAALGMADAVREYDRERRGPDRWMLGRFIVAASRLEELGTAIESEGLSTPRHDPWRVSAVMGVHLPDELSRVNAFRAAWEGRGVTVDALEYKVSSVGQLLTVAEQIPPAYQRFFEVPHEGPYGPLVAAIGRVGAFAKVRTGGTTADLFPARIAFTEFLLNLHRRKCSLQHVLAHYPSWLQKISSKYLHRSLNGPKGKQRPRESNKSGVSRGDRCRYLDEIRSSLLRPVSTTIPRRFQIVNTQNEYIFSINTMRVLQYSNRKIKLTVDKRVFLW